MAEKKPIDPHQKAVAVKYDPQETAPQVVAKGKGYVAEKLLEKAAVSNIPTYKDPKLADELTKIDLGANIPPELYEVVAQVLIFVSDLDKLEAYRRGKPGV